MLKALRHTSFFPLQLDVYPWRSNSACALAASASYNFIGAAGGHAYGIKVARHGDEYPSYIFGWIKIKP